MGARDAARRGQPRVLSCTVRILLCYVMLCQIFLATALMQTCDRKFLVTKESSGPSTASLWPGVAPIMAPIVALFTAPDRGATIVAPRNDRGARQACSSPSSSSCGGSVCLYPWLVMGRVACLVAARALRVRDAKNVMLCYDPKL